MGSLSGLSALLLLGLYLVCQLQAVSSACVDSNCLTCPASPLPKCKQCYIGDPNTMRYRGSVRLPLPATGKCTDYNIANCTKYTVDANGRPSTCTECLTGYVLDNNKCLDCSDASVIANCGECSSSQSVYTCSKCKAGYYLQDNTCKICPESCSECTLNSGVVQCQKCKENNGLKPDKSGCAPCMYATEFGSTDCPACTVNNDGTFVGCTTCTTGFLKDGKCESCDAHLADCEGCSDEDGDGIPEKCTECREYYTVVGGNKCTACQSLGDDCYGCGADDLTKCTQCYYHSWKKQQFWSFRKDGSDCTLCMPKCETCLDNDNNGVADSCTKCLNGTRYFLLDGQCQDCSDVQCAECAGEQTCTSCRAGYKLSANGLGCVSSGEDGSSTAAPVFAPLWAPVVCLLVQTAYNYYYQLGR